MEHQTGYCILGYCILGYCILDRAGFSGHSWRAASIPVVEVRDDHSLSQELGGILGQIHPEFSNGDTLYKNYQPV